MLLRNFVEHIAAVSIELERYVRHIRIGVARRIRRFDVFARKRWQVGANESHAPTRREFRHIGAFFDFVGAFAHIDFFVGDFAPARNVDFVAEGEFFEDFFTRLFDAFRRRIDDIVGAKRTAPHRNQLLIVGR